MQHYKTVQVTAPAETGSAAAGIVQAVMQAKLLQGLQTPRSGLCLQFLPMLPLSATAPAGNGNDLHQIPDIIKTKIQSAGIA